MDMKEYDDAAQGSGGKRNTAQNTQSGDERTFSLAQMKNMYEDDADDL